MLELADYDLKMEIDSVSAMADELAIRQLVAKLARAQDDRDFETYRSCFTDEILVNSPLQPDSALETIQADALIESARPLLTGFDVTHHRVCNEMVWVSGDTAVCEADISAIHIIIENGDSRTVTVGGRYSMALVRQERGWLISERTLRIRYQIGDKSLFPLAQSRGRVRLEGHV